MINRNYAHRTHGQIGSVTFEYPKGAFKLDGKELPEASVAHLMTFALQTLQDAYAGADDLAECIGAFEGKRDKLLAGTLGTRTGGTGIDERTYVIRLIVRTSLKAKLNAGGKKGAPTPEWAAFTGLDDAAQAERLDAIFAKNEAMLSPHVENKLAERKADRERKSAMKIDFDL